MITNRVRNYVVFSLLGAELIGFGIWYCVGGNGMSELFHLRAENVLFEQELTYVRASIQETQKQVVRWQHDDFLREEIARKELQMAREGEEIYLTER